MGCGAEPPTRRDAETSALRRLAPKALSVGPPVLDLHGKSGVVKTMTSGSKNPAVLGSRGG
eukprot:11345895-Prorocentrum_lima.AAC.1